MNEASHQAAPAASNCTGRSPGGFPAGYHARARRPRAHLATVLELRTFDFSNIRIRNDLYVVLCPAVCVLAYTRVALSVRVHALTMSAGQSLQLLVWNTLPSEEDPSQDFVESSPLTSATITSTTAAPSLVTGVMGYDPVAFLKVSLYAIQAPASAPPLRATLSACLILRPD